MTSHDMLEEPPASLVQGPTWSSLVAGLLVCWVGQFAGLVLTLYGVALAGGLSFGPGHTRGAGVLTLGGPAILLLTAAGVATVAGALLVRLVGHVAQRRPVALAIGLVLSVLMAGTVAWQVHALWRSSAVEGPGDLARWMLAALLLAGSSAAVASVATAWGSRWGSRRPLGRDDPLAGFAADAAVIGVAVWAVAVMMVAVVPKYRELFKDFRTSLPLLTEWVLWASDRLQNRAMAFGLLPVLPFSLALPLLAWRTSRPDGVRRRLRATVNLAALGLLLAYATIGAGLYLPMVKLIQSVNGGEPSGD